MSPIEPPLLEELCAWMDGELPEDRARFLQRRLDHDPELRAQWERWQLASACLRGQRVRTQPGSLREQIALAIAAEPAPRRRRWPWAAAAAAAVLVAVLLPRLPGTDTRPPGLGSEAALAEVAQPAAVVEPRFDATRPAEAAPPASPLPSVRDFPLADTAGRKPWPRSPLAPDDRALEAYLVRHNALVAEDGPGGFMPYVDVVAHDRPAAAPATGEGRDP